jgi:hypothetical protein
MGDNKTYSASPAKHLLSATNALDEFNASTSSCGIRKGLSICIANP